MGGGTAAWQGELEGTRFSHRQGSNARKTNGRAIVNRELPQSKCKTGFFRPPTLKEISSRRGGGPIIKEVKNMSETEEKCCEEDCCDQDRAWWTHLFGRRTLMAYAFTGATVYGFLIGLIDPQKFAEMVMLILAYYFMTRNGEEKV